MSKKNISKILLENKKMKYYSIGVIAISLLLVTANFLKQNKVISEVGDYKIRYRDIDYKLDFEASKILKEYPSMERTELEERMAKVSKEVLTAIENEKILELKSIELGAVNLDKEFKDNINKSIKTIESSFSNRKEFKKYLKLNGLNKDG